MAEATARRVPALQPRGRDATMVLTTPGILAYGALGLPLAFAALPIYVHAPALYAEGVGMSLASVGGVLVAARALDALSDPLIGWASDRLVARRLMIFLSLPLLAFGMLALLAPPAGAGAAWLGTSVFVVTLGFSLATINHGAWGAELARLPADRTRVVAAREGFGLLGVVLAAALPGMLADDRVVGLARLAWVFVPLLVLAASITLWRAPVEPVARRSPGQGAPQGLLHALAHRPFALLLAIFALNGIAAAIPASTVLFYVSDVLGHPARAGLFLVLYFVAAGASLPLWVRLSARLGKLRAWQLSMLLAIAVFVWAWTLGSGDVMAFALICVLSGAALGADLSLPTAMLADLLARDTRADEAHAGAWFGWWNFVTKANLALAAGLALPLLALFGYAPGTAEPQALAALAAIYALLPCVLKLAGATLLWSLRHALDFEKAFT